MDGLGRDVARIARIQAQVDLNIIVATGVYTYTDVPHFFFFRGPGVIPGLPDPMVDFFVRDLEEGVRGTDVRAGFLKCAIDEHGLTGGVERVLRAVAGAHLRTGAPVMVHTHPGSQTGLEVKRVLGEEGVAFDRVLLAHHYVLPTFYGTTTRIAYWDKFEHLQELPYYSIGFPDVWWSKSAG